jgi:hypothetical protein
MSDPNMRRDCEDAYDSATREANRRKKDVLEACRRAVASLERFAADARREVERTASGDDGEPSRLATLPVSLLSLSQFGAMNAATDLTSAILRAAEYENALGVLEGLSRAGHSGRRGR